MRWTKGVGAWPAFWLSGYAHSQGHDCPPLNAELDIFEGQGNEPNVFYGTLHKNTNSVSRASADARPSTPGNAWQVEGHVFPYELALRREPRAPVPLSTQPTSRRRTTRALGQIWVRSHWPTVPDRDAASKRRPASLLALTAPDPRSHDGKEGVDGSSPSEGSQKFLLISPF